MNKSKTAGLLIGALMLAAAWCSQAMAPTVRMADLRPRVVLEQAIPRSFGQWREDASQAAAVVNPTTQAELNKIYAETISRTYVNRAGERIMLSIAYGSDQRDNLAVHFPEGCYGGQGFAVGRTSEVGMATLAGTIPTSRMVASLNSRIEPISYWVVVGDTAVPNSWEVKKVKLSYSLKGLIPDATLMRVSTVDGDVDGAYRLHQSFVNDMLGSMTPELRRHFAGIHP